MAKLTVLCVECSTTHDFHPQMVEKTCQCGAKVRRPK